MPVYRLVVTIPSEVFINVASLDDAEKFINWLSDQYDKVCYPISSTSETRAGVASVKCMSIEPASEGDHIHAMNSTQEAQSAMHQPVNLPEMDREPPDGPNSA